MLLNWQENQEKQFNRTNVFWQIARQNSDNDDELQQLIGEFNLKRMAINNEAAKENRDEAKLQQLNSELRETYAKVMQNKNMNAYNEAKELMDNMLKRINAIISISAEGGDPEIADLTEDTCGGSCSSCAGCH